MARDAVVEAVTGLALPLPGRGRTAERHRALHDMARDQPVWVARLVEGHADALAILAEAGRAPVDGSLYGVWASGGDLRLDGAGRVTGSKPFCSGLGIVDRALVTAGGPDGDVLLDLGVRPGPGVEIDLSGWATPALAKSATGRLHLRDHLGDAVVGAPGWYLARPGFWHGACGPAAVWAGATAAVIASAADMVDDNPHRRAHLGGVVAAGWALQALLASAGHEIDRTADDVLAAQRRALSLRHVVERLCTDVLDRFGRAFGPRPFVGDADIAQRVADIHLYLRQDHAERDLGALGDTF